MDFLVGLKALPRFFGTSTSEMVLEAFLTNRTGASSPFVLLKPSYIFLKLARHCCIRSTVSAFTSSSEPTDLRKALK
jgi:hypothetical protein